MTDVTFSGSYVAPPRAKDWSGIYGLIFVLAVIPYLAPEALPWAKVFPDAWKVPLSVWIRDGLNWLVKDLSFGLFTFKEMTRAMAAVMAWPLDLAKAIFFDGVTLGDVHLPRLSWAGVILAMTVWGWALGGRGLAAVGFVSLSYIALFGQWNGAMLTLSMIVIAVPLGIGLGLLLGIAAWRSPRLRQALVPLLDLMQTVPTFAYLVPIMFLIGVGPVSGIFATVLYAMPPMTRVTMIALDGVAPELAEAGLMAGASSRQILWKIMVPSAGKGLLVGVNQVIMLSLNMVIIAAMVGAGGLGFDVLNALRIANGLGPGLETGLAVVALAIVLDRYSQAAAAPRRGLDPARRRLSLRLGLGLLVGFTLLSVFVPVLEELPKGARLSTGAIWSDLVRWINLNMFEQLDAIRTFLVLNLLKPFKEFLIGFPWPAMLLLVGAIGWRLGGRRLALLVVALLAFIPLTGMWERGMTTVYLCGISAAFAVVLGVLLGILGAHSDRWHRFLENMNDTLQTLPSFVYLLPVVMLFRVGDVSALFAVVAYSIVPAIRYTDHGLRRVPPNLIEAAAMDGCTRRQILFKVEIPYALPEIMLGVNQVIMMALSMLVVTSLIGTNDLGKAVQMAITKAEPGDGLVAGLAIAFLGITADRLIAAWATARKRKLGIP
ncbi:ABC transporter permease subunit [Oleomonas cavernae]|uniref:ABC transporter permease subunit n=1 Tax=Oleomonas cavernae TaxID=2320859 RepID=A0A418WBA6_9PROT|nr:ABC transporter permease subunit [Oleomonas cavernae]RJF87333.1 ABC transporter permease subunit [Oleomonas cavernae]